MSHRVIFRAVIIALGALPVARSGVAQAASDWRFSVTPYGWMTGLEGDVGINNVVSRVDLGFGDILKHLRFAAMAGFEARKNRLVFDADAIYASLTGSKAVAVRGASGELTFDQRETILQAGIGYTPFSTPLWTVDLIVGARYWNLNAELGLDPANRDARERSGNRDWLDATVGTRIYFKPVEDWHLMAGGDVGGGGSQSTWQLAGTATYDLSTRYGLTAGYKDLAVNYDRDQFLFDTHTRGWLVGVTIRF